MCYTLPPACVYRVSRAKCYQDGDCAWDDGRCVPRTSVSRPMWWVILLSVGVGAIVLSLVGLGVCLHNERNNNDDDDDRRMAARRGVAARPAAGPNNSAYLLRAPYGAAGPAHASPA